MAITARHCGKQEACLYQKQYISKLLPGSTESSPDENISNIYWSNKILAQTAVPARGVVEIIFSACAQFCSLINGIQLFVCISCFYWFSWPIHSHNTTAGISPNLIEFQMFRTSRNCSIFFWFCSSKPGRDCCRNVQHKEGRPACLHHLEPAGRGGVLRPQSDHLHDRQSDQSPQYRWCWLPAQRALHL